MWARPGARTSACRWQLQGFLDLAFGAQDRGKKRWIRRAKGVFSMQLQANELVRCRATDARIMELGYFQWLAKHYARYSRCLRLRSA